MDTSKYSDLELNDARIMGAKLGVETMLFYYMSALAGKVDDIKQYMANRMPAMIDLTEEQSTYVASSINNTNTVLNSLNTCISLLVTVLESDETDEESIQLVIDILQNLREECESAIKTYLAEPKDNKDES